MGFSSDSKFGKIDLHGMNRGMARDALLQAIITFLTTGKESLLVVHGFHHGTVLRDYLRKGRFVRDLRNEYPLFPPVEIIEYQPGATKILIRWWEYHAT